VPVRGEIIPGPGEFEIEILDADPRRVKRLRVSRRPPEAPKREPRRRPGEAASKTTGETSPSAGQRADDSSS
jgi:hypothetical protein